MPNSAFARLEIDGPIATLTLDRPQRRKAIAVVEDCDAVITALITAQRQDGAAGLILTGAGSAFCAGGDLQALRSGRGIGPRPDTAELQARRPAGAAAGLFRRRCTHADIAFRHIPDSRRMAYRCMT